MFLTNQVLLCLKRVGALESLYIYIYRHIVTHVSLKVRKTFGLIESPCCPQAEVQKAVNSAAEVGSIGKSTN